MLTSSVCWKYLSNSYQIQENTLWYTKCYTSLWPRSGKITYPPLYFNICCVFTALKWITLLWEVHPCSMHLQLCLVQGIPTIFSENKGVFTMSANWPGRMRPFATRPTNRATILYRPFPWPLWERPSRKSLMCFYSSTQGSESPGLVLLGMRCLQLKIMSNKQKMFLLDLDPFIVQGQQLEKLMAWCKKMFFRGEDTFLRT